MGDHVGIPGVVLFLFFFFLFSFFPFIHFLFSFSLSFISFHLPNWSWWLFNQSQTTYWSHLCLQPLMLLTLESPAISPFAHSHSSYFLKPKEQPRILASFRIMYLRPEPYHEVAIHKLWVLPIQDPSATILVPDTWHNVVTGILPLFLAQSKLFCWVAVAMFFLFAGLLCCFFVIFMGLWCHLSDFQFLSVAGSAFNPFVDGHFWTI